MAIATPSIEAPLLVLASTSVYRRALLERLGLPFACVAPEVDENPRADEAPSQRAIRLAAAKAQAVACLQSQAAIVVGSDQVASLAGGLLRKPHTFERAREQLAASSGREVEFHTAVSVIDTRTGRQLDGVDHTVVHFRELDPASIERYLEREKPLDCAGSFKCEGLGISLFRAIQNSDPTALIGLPMIFVAAALREFGLAVP